MFQGDECSRGMSSVSSTAHWRLGRDCGIIQTGVNREKALDSFSWGEVPNNVIKYFIGVECNKC